LEQIKNKKNLAHNTQKNGTENQKPKISAKYFVFSDKKTNSRHKQIFFLKFLLPIYHRSPIQSD